MSLKAKLSPQDLDDVLQRLQLNDKKMSSFAHFDQSSSSINSTQPPASNSNKTSGNLQQQIGSNGVKDESVTSVVASESSTSELDSTFVADQSSTNLNTSVS